MKEATEGTRKPRGVIDIKKHYATSNCPIFDIVLYTNLKQTPQAGQLFSKIKFEEVKSIIQQGNFKPTPLSETLYYKKFQPE